MLIVHHLMIKHNLHTGTHENQQTLVFSLVMPSKIQVHRQVLLNDAKISEKKLALDDFLQKFDFIVLKSNNDIGQMDLIEMHIATRLDATPVAAHPYPLALKHPDFLKQEIKNLLDAGITLNSAYNEKNMWRFCFIIGGFSLRATSL